MPALRCLPPQFLLPAWSIGQLYHLSSLQRRSLHAVSNPADGTEGEEQAGPLGIPGTNKPLIKKSHRRPTGRPAGRPPKKSATAFTSLRRTEPHEPRVVLPILADRDAVQNALLDEDRLSASEVGIYATRNKRSSSSKRMLKSSTEDRKREPGSQNLFRNVGFLKIRPLHSSEIAGECGGWRSPGKRGGEVETFRVRRYDTQHALRRDQHERAGAENQSGYAETKELGGKSKPNHNDTRRVSNYQWLTEPTGSWGRSGDQVKHGEATSREKNFATTTSTARASLIVSKETAQILRRETTTEEKSSPETPIRSAPVQAHLKNTQQQAPKKPSLFEELFPEEARKRTKIIELEPAQQADLPPLPPLDFDILPEFLEDFQSHSKPNTWPSTCDNSSDSFRREETTILILSRATNSLSEADFRRVVPTRGEHIEGWRGPGDILKGTFFKI